MRSSSLLNMSIGFAVWLNWRDMDDREGEASVPACQPTDLGSWRGSDDAAWARRFARRRHGSGLSRLPQRSGRALLPLLGIAPGFGGSGSGDVRPGSPHREGFRGDSSTRTWLFSIATRVCLDLLRGRKRRIVPATRWDPSSPSQPLESPPEDIAWLGPLYPRSICWTPQMTPPASIRPVRASGWPSSYGTCRSRHPRAIGTGTGGLAADPER